MPSHCACFLPALGLALATAHARSLIGLPSPGQVPREADAPALGTSSCAERLGRLPVKGACSRPLQSWRRPLAVAGRRARERARTLEGRGTRHLPRLRPVPPDPRAPPGGRHRTSSPSCLCFPRLASWPAPRQRLDLRARSFSSRPPGGLRGAQPPAVPPRCAWFPTVGKPCLEICGRRRWGARRERCGSGGGAGTPAGRPRLARVSVISSWALSAPGPLVGSRLVAHDQRSVRWRRQSRPVLALQPAGCVVLEEAPAAAAFRDGFCSGNRGRRSSDAAQWAACGFSRHSHARRSPPASQGLGVVRRRPALVRNDGPESSVRRPRCALHPCWRRQESRLIHLRKTSC